MHLREDPYGTVKRIRVFREWIEEERARWGGRRLSILDFGCGTGLAVTVPLALGGDLAHGVDLHQPSIALARERNRLPNLTFGCESATELRERGCRYDVVVCSEVLEHLEDPTVCLRELRELLVPQGLLLVTVPNGLGGYEMLQKLDRALQRLGIARLLDDALWAIRAIRWRLLGRGLPPRPGEECPPDEAVYLNVDSRHVQFFRLRALERLFREAGFKVEARRARVLLCGPYADFWMSHLSFSGWTYALNGWLADRLPMSWAADWMFRLKPVPRYG